MSLKHPKDMTDEEFQRFNGLTDERQAQYLKDWERDPDTSFIGAEVPKSDPNYDQLADDVEPPSKLSQTLSKVREGAKKVASKAGEAAESAGNAGKAKLKSYFGKRTPDQIKAEQDAIDARQAQKDYEEEQKYQAEIQRQPSKFEGDVAKVAKGTKNLIKKGITLTKPVVKSIVKGVGKTAITAGKAGIQAGARMGKGMAKIDEEEKSSRNPFTPKPMFSPQKQQQRAEPSKKPQKPYNDDFFVSGGLGKRGSGGNSEFSIGGGNRKSAPPQKKASSGKPQKPYNDDYFVGGKKKMGGNQEDADDYFVSTKKPSQKPPKKGKGGNTRGFGLGF